MGATMARRRREREAAAKAKAAETKPEVTTAEVPPQAPQGDAGQLGEQTPPAGEQDPSPQQKAYDARASEAREAGIKDESLIDAVAKGEMTLKKAIKAEQKNNDKE